MSDHDRVIEALTAGLVVGLPTDTVYGVGVDAFRQTAVRALFGLKDRPAVKPIPILVADVAQAERLGEIDDRALALAGEHWPGPLTVVVPRRPGLPPWLGDPRTGTIGVRVPDHPDTLAVLAAFGPLAVTSANRSGADPAADDRGAREIFGDRVAAYLPGVSGGGEPSTVVDLTGEEAQVLRPGPIRFEETS